MTIGARIKQGRLKTSLSQRQLAAKIGVSAQAISKYERDLDVPGSKVLIQLSKALDLRIEFFLRPASITKIEPKFRKRMTLSVKGQDALLSSVQDWLERYLEIEGILSEEAPRFDYPEGFPKHVTTLQEIEQAAEALRRAWGLGAGPIEDLTGLLEDKGIKVGTIEADPKFDACTFQAEIDGGVTAIVTRKGIPGDRQRFSLAHELGHLILITHDLDEEKAALRFAAAFLIPEATASSELHGKRVILSIYELHILKHRYGASMSTWIHRAEELGIISKSRAKSLYQLFSAQDWRKIEPGDPNAPEIPRRFERMVMGAMAEGIISETRAGELLGRPVRSFLDEEAKTHGEWLAAVCY
jgi:Zn-dependent peptidase ImmA (M78 family)/transcriptional regulator with XRE-family HTH domain